ncbi:MAG: HAMP domain-containing sensor histidine kinase [Acidimicrobiales bacterium]
MAGVEAATTNPATRLLATLRTGASSVRGRSTLLAALVVAVTLAFGALLLLTIYRNQLISSLDTTLEQQVADRAALLDGGTDPQSLTTVSAEEAVVWIGRDDGIAVAVGGTVIPLESPVPPVVGTTAGLELLVEENKGGEHEDERELSQMRVASARSGDGLIVIAGAEVETVDKAVTGLGRLFAIALPPLVALVAGLTWFTTGRALRPVEDIRSRAAEISGTSLSDRVPVPPTDDEIGHLAETMNAMLERIESHEYSLRQFTADASHELKSPVANLRALVDTADLSDPGWLALQSQLAGESDRLRDLVDNLLFLASHQAGRPPGGSEGLALDELLFVEAELLAATGVVTVDLTGVEPTELVGSTSDLRRLVRNLVDNAARHAESTVALSVGTGGGEIILVVGDDGPGIPPDDRGRVFERFTRLDQARARGEGGSGLGLAIAKQIADSHGATIEIADSPLGGAEFRVVFPGGGVGR